MYDLHWQTSITELVLRVHYTELCFLGVVEDDIILAVPANQSLF